MTTLLRFLGLLPAAPRAGWVGVAHHIAAASPQRKQKGWMTWLRG